jgi:thiamine-phosphate pyrophosphorylase
MSVDLRLYALVDPERSGGRRLADIAREVVAGGATLVQLRDKTGSTLRQIEEARAIKAGADGVHVGWDDMPVADARALLGREAIIGLSIKTPEQAKNAPLELLDYVCIGGVFETQSKNNPEPPVGATGFAELAAIIRNRKPAMPAGAIAGIDETNAAKVIAAGADGVANISALSLAPDPKVAAQKLRAIVDAALSQRGAA